MRQTGVAAGSRVSALGFVALGASAYGVLLIASRSLGAADYGRFAVFWALAFTVGPGLFFPLEQELTRAVAAAGGVSSSLIGRALVLAVGLLVTGAGVLVVLPPVPAKPALVASLGVFLILHVLRGLFAGARRFRNYAATLAAEGAGRLLAVAMLAIFGLGGTGTYAAAVALAPIVFLPVLASKAQRLVTTADKASWRQLTPALGWLVVSSLLAQALINAAPVAYAVMTGPKGAAGSGRFLNAVALNRVPLFIFAGYQAALLPSLVQRVTGNGRALRNWLRSVVVVFLGAAMVGLTLEAAIGPDLLQATFGSHVSAVVLVLIGASTLGYMAALTFTALLIALQAQALVALCWMAGVPGLLTMLAFRPWSVDITVGVASLLATWGVACASGAACLLRLPRGATHRAASGR